MNEHEAFSRDNFPGDTLPALLARLLDAFECNKDRAIQTLLFKHLHGKHPLSPNQPTERTEGILNASNRAAEGEIREKTLHTRTKYLEKYGELLETWYLQNKDRFRDTLDSDIALYDDLHKRSVQEVEDSDFRTPLDVPASKAAVERLALQLETDPNLKEAYAEELKLDPLSPGFDVALRVYEDLWNSQEAGYLRYLGTPSSTLFWAKELVGRLAEITEREHELQRHPFSGLADGVPVPLQILFEQANLLYLFDFDIPCVLTCGTLIEELLERNFPILSGGWSQRQSNEHKSVRWEEKVDSVIRNNPKLLEIRGTLLFVMKGRNSAAHDPADYILNIKFNAPAILQSTRKILDVFYRPNSRMGEA